MWLIKDMVEVGLGLEQGLVPEAEDQRGSVHGKSGQ